MRTPLPVRLLFFLLVMHTALLLGQDIRQAVQIGLENNPKIRAAAHESVGAEIEARSAFRSTLPQFNFDASYRHVTAVPELQIPAPPVPGYQPPVVSLGVYDSYETGISIQYVLFSGFAQKNQVRLKRQQALVAGQELERTKKEVAFAIIAAYRQVQSAVLQVEALQAARERIEIQLKRLTSLVQQGMSLSVDTLSLSLAELNYDQQIIQAQAELENARQLLNALVGKDIRVQSDSLIHPPAMLPELRLDLVETMRSLEVRKKMSLISADLKKAAFYPSLAVQAAYKYGKPGLDMIKNEWMHYGVWGVSLHWNLFNWKADRLKIAAEREKARKIVSSRQALADQLKTEFDKNIRLYRALQKQTTVLEKALKLARRKMTLTKEQYEQGLQSATDFNTANLELTEARLKLERHRLNLILKYNQLQYMSGQPISEWSM